MKRFLTALLALGSCLLAQAEATLNLDSIYLQLDRAIDSSAVFLQRKTLRLDSMKQQLHLATDDEQRFQRAKTIYEEYVPFDNDSALAYQYLCMDLASRMQQDDRYAETLMALADQLTESGFYNEARMHYEQTLPLIHGDSLQNAYLLGLVRLYGEMGYYSHDPRLREQFFQQSDHLRDSLLHRLDSTSAVWLQQQTMMCTNQQRLDKAMRYSLLWEQLCPPDSRAYATMAYYRSTIYAQQGNWQMQRLWLARSAMVDIRNAIMDQGSLWSLAETFLAEEQHLDRAHRYINFSWQCLSRFSTHMRSWLVAPVLTRINNEYKDQLEKANNHLLWAIILVSLLAVGLLASLFYVQKKRRQLATARNELKGANDELASLNGQLAGKNDQLEEANALLHATNEQLRTAVIHRDDSNRVKDEYLGKFISLCSSYIDKLDNYRIRVNRKLLAKQYADLVRMTSSEQLKEDEVNELFDNFDTVFLHLFPTFIDDFNALLRPEERILPPDHAHLNTDLRIFALIRLGIDESSKIAEFLRYSPNSIYAYRSRIKNKAAGPRDDFERQVKEIGIQE